MTKTPHALLPARPEGWAGPTAVAFCEAGALGILLWWLLGGSFAGQVLYLMLAVFGFAIMGLMLVFNAQRRDSVGGPNALGWVFLFTGVLCWVLAPVPSLVTGQHANRSRDGVIGVIGLVTLGLLVWAFIAQRRRAAAARTSNERPIEPAWIATHRGPRFNPPPIVRTGRDWRMVAFSIGMTILTPLLLFAAVITHQSVGKQVAVLVAFAFAVASWAVLVGERWPVPGPRPLGWVFIAIGWVVFAAADVVLFLGADSADSRRMAIVLLVETLLIGALTFWGWTRQRAWIAWYFRRSRAGTRPVRGTPEHLAASRGGSSADPSAQLGSTPTWHSTPLGPWLQ